MASIDFAKVKLIPIASVLAHYKVEVRKRSNTELVANCPFPSHEKSAHKQFTLAISIEKNKWFDHSDTCRAAGNHPKGGDVIDLVARIENITPLEAAKKLAELYCVGVSNGATVTTPPSKPSSGTVVNQPLAFELKGIQHDHPFILERGITAETAREFGIGFFPGKGSMANRVVFPCYENGSLVAYIGRTVLPVSEENPKWKLPQGLHRTFLYGLERCDPSKPLIVSESPWACLWFHQNGMQAAALLGSSLTEAQEKLLAPFHAITIAMDNDTAGRDAAAKIAERLKATHKLNTAYLKG